MAKLLWTGSDALYATRFIGGSKFPSRKIKYIYFLGYTIFAKIADLFVQSHYVVSEHMINVLKPLKLKKPIEVLIDPPQDVKHIEKVPHKGFNILYYIPISKNRPFTEWCYGYDVFCDVMDYFNNNNSIRFYVVDGKSPIDIYRLTDLYLRPNRSDGAPRMIMECEQLGIPFYWSKKNPNKEDIINFINDALQKTQDKI